METTVLEMEIMDLRVELATKTEMAKTTVVEKPPHLIRGMALSRQRNSIPGFQNQFSIHEQKRRQK
mgnify:FL=1